MQKVVFCIRFEITFHWNCFRGFCKQTNTYSYTDLVLTAIFQVKLDEPVLPLIQRFRCKVLWQDVLPDANQQNYILVYWSRDVQGECH